jgi:hypothetical protein
MAMFDGTYDDQWLSPAERLRLAVAEIERLRAIIREGGWTDQDIDKWVAARAADQPDAACICPISFCELPLGHNGRCGTTADQQSARKGLDELTRMAQEDGLYDEPEVPK